MHTSRLARLKAGADWVLKDMPAEMRRLQRARRLAQRRPQRVADTVSEVAFILFVWSCPDAAMALQYVATQETSSLCIFLL